MQCENLTCQIEPGWIKVKFLKRRGYYLESSWYCGEPCLEKGILQRLDKINNPSEKSFQTLLRIKIGHILLENGVINKGQLDQAIAEQQKDPHDRIGYYLRALEFATEHDITIALGRQFGLPVINLNQHKIDLSLLDRVPAEVVRHSKFFPMEYEKENERLVVVTYDPSDLTTIINLRSMLDCDVSIYLCDESVVKNQMDQYCKLAEAKSPSASMTCNNLADDLSAIVTSIVDRARKIKARSLNVRYFNKLVRTRYLVNRQPKDFFVNAA